MQPDRSEHPAASPRPTFVDGIGPPLEQIEEDYREWVERESYTDRTDNKRIAKDVLALAAEVKRLRGIADAARRYLAASSRLEFHPSNVASEVVAQAHRRLTEALNALN